MRYDGKVTIVTGGSKGIGEGCVRVFAAAGSKVVFCSRGADDGKALEAEVNATGVGEAAFVKCDVTKPEDIQRLIDFAVEKYGRIDCLINNAGAHPDHRPIDGFSVEDFQALLNLNLVSYFAASKYALPHLRKVKGNIINMSSLVGKIGQVGAVTYCATKGGIDAFSRALAVDEAQFDVRVNTVSPGNVWTPMWAAGIVGAADPPPFAERATRRSCWVGWALSRSRANCVCTSPPTPLSRPALTLFFRAEPSSITAARPAKMLVSALHGEAKSREEGEGGLPTFIVGACFLLQNWSLSIQPFGRIEQGVQ